MKTRLFCITLALGIYGVVIGEEKPVISSGGKTEPTERPRRSRPKIQIPKPDSIMCIMPFHRIQK